MRHMHHEALSMRVLVALRLFFVLLGLTSLILGYIGLHHYIDVQILLRQRPLHDDSTSNLVYYDAELFLLQCAPLSAGGPVPWQLQIARFSGPSVALYTLAELGAALFATRIRRAGLRRARGHMVVCGSTRAAKVLAARLRAAGSRVLVVESVAGDAERTDRDVSLGDAGLPRTLADVGAHRAAALYACHDHGDQNARIAEAAAELRRTTGHPRKIQVLIPDQSLCTALRACLVQSDAQHMGYFNPDELAAQTTVRTDRTALCATHPEIAIAGTGAFARSILVEFARQHAAAGGPDRARRLSVLLIGEDAPETAAALLGRYAFLAGACRIQPHTEALEAVLTRRRDDPSARPLTRLYLCHEDENDALITALDQAAHLQSTFDEIVVRLDRMAGMAAAFRAGPGAGGLVHALAGRLHLVDVTSVGCDPELIRDDLAEWLARACHQRHLTERLRAGARPGSSPALVRWEELGEEYRASSRHQALDIGRKLDAIGCLISPRRAGGPPFAYLDGEVERLAEMEHERWISERTGLGWRRGPELRERARQHPDLLPWSMLAPSSRDLDIRAVRDIPGMLADAGLEIVRRDPRTRPRTAADGGPDPAVSPAVILPARSR